MTKFKFLSLPSLMKLCSQIRTKRFFFATVAASCFTARMWCMAAKDDRIELARSMLDKAFISSKLRAEGQPPFRIKVNFRFLQDNGKFAEGSYLLVWAGPSLSREEIAFPDYKEITVRTEDTIWTSSSQRYRPIVISRLIDGLNIDSGWNETLRKNITKVDEVESDGIQMMCAEENRRGETMSEFCVDSETGTMVRKTWTFFNLVYRYRDFVPWEGGKYPRMIYFFHGSVMTASARVELLRAEPQPDPALFSPLTGPEVRSAPNCKESKVEKAKFVKHPNPKYAENLRKNKIEGMVSIFAVIGIDGLLHDLTIVHSAGVDLDASALDAVKKWRYKPTTCEGVPIEVETEVDINFSLSN